MSFTPIDSGMATLSTVRVHTVNLILCLIFGQVGIMNPYHVGGFGENGEGHLVLFVLSCGILGPMGAIPWPLVPVQKLTARRSVCHIPALRSLAAAMRSALTCMA